MRRADGDSAVRRADGKAATLRLGTRGSTLARTQSEWVAKSLVAQGFSVDLVEVTTQGDTDPRALAQIGGTGVFAAALRTALLAGQVDLAVHSLKDLPVEQPAGLVLAALPVREDPRDAIVGAALDALPPRARVGTGSPRRAAQLAAERPDLDVLDCRGNIDTRIGFVRDGRYDAVVLAAAGLARIGRLDEAAEVFAADRMLPAPGQGALAVEVADPELAGQLAFLDDADTRLAVTAERAVLAGLRAGCSTPVGALARLADGALTLAACVGPVRTSGTVPQPDLAGADALGRRVAADLLDRGAATYLTTTDPRDEMGQH